MFGRKRIQNFTNRVHRLYDSKFSYVESMLNSCVTLDQLDHSARWGSTVMTQFMNHEKQRLNQLCNLLTYIELTDVVSEYFSLKQDIIGLIFERKVKEIEAQEPVNEEE